ncbi:MAG TPA: hypothetical protein VFZ45_03180, partial [Actinomycetota bacterium]|nr:hypothetical protein [Actinomycetota bacterium]
MEERTKLGMIGAAAGFGVAAAFGIGLLSMAVFLRGDSVWGSDTAEAGESGQAQVLRVTLKDLAIEPPSLQAQPGPIRIEVVNDGQVPHNFAVGDDATPMLETGESATLELPS